MFQIEDGRESFYQWDINRRLIVNDKTINEVHFCNRTDTCSLVVKVYEENNKRFADVPNILLQTDWRINVYGYDKDYTKHCKQFNVFKRTKPAEYVYTETEVLNWNEIIKRVEAVEAMVDEDTLRSAVFDYLEQNPVEAGATEAEAAQIEANKNATQTNARAITSLEKAVNEKASIEYVDNLVNNLDIPEGGTGAEEVYIGTSAPTGEEEIWINPNEQGTEYATKAYVEAQLETIVIPDTSSFVTEEETLTLINSALGVIENGTY